MEVVRTAILDFCRRKRGEAFHPSEIVRQMFPEDWELFLADLHAELNRMQQENLIRITADQNPLGVLELPEVPVCITIVGKPK